MKIFLITVLVVLSLGVSVADAQTSTCPNTSGSGSNGSGNNGGGNNGGGTSGGNN